MKFSLTALGLILCPKKLVSSGALFSSSKAALAAFIAAALAAPPYSARACAAFPLFLLSSSN
jgi:hypothetical protein